MPSLQRIHFEFTTRCNLKCTYCGTTRPWHRKHDLDLKDFDSWLTELLALGVQEVNVSGAGETTIVKDWDVYLDKLLGAGFRVAILSNLAKPLTGRNISALSRCSEIHTSCDTVDPELYAKIRAGSDLRTFFHNIARIRARALLDGREPPRLIWNCVASAQVILDVLNWTATGIVVGADHLQISELTSAPALPGTFQVDPVGTLPLQDILRAAELVEQARELARRANRGFSVLPALERVLSGERRSLHAIPHIQEVPGGRPVLLYRERFVQILDEQGNALRISQDQDMKNVCTNDASRTRNCVLPWSEAYVWAEGTISPCEMYPGQPIPEEGITAALETGLFNEVRERLLSGDLLQQCWLCTMFPWTTPAALAERVEALQMTPAR